jgi:hypothetical protein
MKVGLSTGIPCPKRDGEFSCSFCVQSTFIDDFVHTEKNITSQIDYLVHKIKNKVKAHGYIAYFQDNTSSFGDINYLCDLFQQASAHPDILELIISTRPDFLSKEFLDMLQGMAKPVSIEIGIQSIHDASLALLHRGHTQSTNESATYLCQDYSFDIGVHIILGIPGESILDIEKTAHWINSQTIISDVKIHHLAIFEGATIMHTDTAPISLCEYIPILAHFISHLRPEVTISRLFTSNLNRHQTMKNDFPGVKRNWIDRLYQYLVEHDIYQGKSCKTHIQCGSAKHSG